VCLFGLLEQLVGLFGMEERTRVCVPVWPSGAAGGKGACDCLLGLLTRVCAFWACGSSSLAFLTRMQGRVWVPFWLGGACVCLFGLSARVCAFLVCWRVVGTAGGPSVHRVRVNFQPEGPRPLAK